MIRKPSIALITPALAAANNGNWRTAERWRRMLADDYAVRLLPAWDGDPRDVALIALHARRSHASITAWARSRQEPLAVVLTGTDVYGDLPRGDAATRASCAAATRLVVLQDEARRALPDAWRDKARVIIQSATPLRPVEHKPLRHLRAVVAGHLRDEKAPGTVLEAARLLHDSGEPIFIDHIGAALDERWADAARATAAACPRYRWLGALAHGQTRRRIQHAHLLVHPSQQEGGAQVIAEALCAGTPVLASRISGNLGMLGGGWPAYFEPGDAQGLAARLRQAEADRATLAQWRLQGERRAPLFAPERERQALGAFVHELFLDSTDPSP